MREDGKETVEHFTTENSLLPSDNVLSIAIHESTGEVFIGTSRGLVSYMSDAVKPEADFNNLYAYPNPVSQIFDYQHLTLPLKVVLFLFHLTD